MFKKISIIVFAIVCVVFVGYLVLPNPPFPKPPPDSLQSQEPADLESPLRQSYFTNFTRDQVISWYENQFNQLSFLGLKLPTLLFNYPPEEAQTLIRDQTSSTFLQELVHPLRESIYINGFKPPSDKDEPIFFVGGKHWVQKIIIRSVPSPMWARLVIFAGTAVLAWVVCSAWIKSLCKNS
jgi:hypothetical protein